jgi:hypothetical protein
MVVVKCLNILAAAAAAAAANDNDDDYWISRKERTPVLMYVAWNIGK